MLTAPTVYKNTYTFYFQKKDFIEALNNILILFFLSEKMTDLAKIIFQVVLSHVDLLHTLINKINRKAITVKLSHKKTIQSVVVL